MSGQLAIQSAIVNALLAAPVVASGNVKANTTRPLSAGQNLACVVRLAQSRAATPQVLGGPYDWTTRFDVECLARAALGSADPVAAVDGLLEQVWARLSTLPTSGLGVIDVRMNPSIDWQVDDADAPAASATVSLFVNHRTQANTLAAWT